MEWLKKKYVFALIYAILLISFTVYIALDTFVIQRTYSKVEESSKVEQIVEESENESKNAVITNNSYKDDNISIVIDEYREYDTTIYVADIKVSDIKYLKTALAKNSYGKNITEKTSKIASDNNAILAINGDFYGVQEKGFVLKNGVVYRDIASNNQEDLVIYENGIFEIINESETNLNNLLDNGAYNVLSFGPCLLENNKIQISVTEEVGKAMASNPRTAIGVIDELHYVFVVSDGRTNESEGLSLYELAEFMQSLGVELAYNLDGGGSSTMYFNGNIINNPTTNGKTIKERSVSDIVYIGY